MTTPDFTREDFAGLFSELAEVLKSAGHRAQIFVVGGAAMALAYDEERTTRDVDALFTNTGATRQAALVVARRHGLPNDWLNDAAKGFLLGNDPAPKTIFEFENLIVQVASAEYLLSMKLMSGRPGRDYRDAALLFNVAGYTTVEEAVNLLERTQPASLLLPRHRYICLEVAQLALELRGETSADGDGLQG
ncbi:hypothetical protein SAMN05421878_10827 [Actinobaculum suis]|uniref:DUF6036 family nucleotidyltransferase n=1 Tax=Actinobaculum suis TaxID=1657 RepID=A0A0K9EST3_9ACTO|nr:DUF6036 family nucleotidyltransferase [Actinobaculum suis]KMY22921.1 nucleotidyl transferase [Actinobaculum suis]MDY5152520.1 DUF6036 family nucleotidyltransferase [Actinobaculum suis]SDE40334.1 hypothetical protein SAMN05421878_10827 [Actinobaculum suis]VDG75576.1 Nucleotidyl transferase of uncharacterised function (DUF2204) [Actinobaculum suis]